MFVRSIRSAAPAFRIPGRPFAATLIGLLLVFTAASGCQRPVRGAFGWSAVDDRGLGLLEERLLTETEFKMGRERLYFFDYETIWWIYEVQGGRYDEDSFIAALYENNTTPMPIEVDLRRVPLIRDRDQVYIRQSYEQLPPGQYLLVIAHNETEVDRASFWVVPPGGPAALGAEEELDDPEPGAAADPILQYSGYPDATRP